MNLRENIILCGFMGTGKSTVGPLVARRLSYSFIDSDDLIEKRCQMSIPLIFKKHGEEFFRIKENQIANEMISNAGIVLAAGGGMIISEQNYELLSKSGKLILLTASIDTIMERVNGNTTRPLLKGPDIRNQIKLLLSERQKSYDRIKCQINTDNLSLKEVCGEIVRIGEFSR